MAGQFTVLASGSGGNCSLISHQGQGLLIDAGLRPRTLKRRLEAVGANWDSIQGVLLTHTHGDHWNEYVLAEFARRQIRLYCHDDHLDYLFDRCVEIDELEQQDLVTTYRSGKKFRLGPDLSCLPFPVLHDGGATFGFRIESRATARGKARWRLAYVADLGTWDDELVSHLADADILALEFNHDETLERNSHRSEDLVERVLSDFGHLSNDQAAALLHEVLRASANGSLRHLVQLHLSRQCNCPDLAQQVARAVLQRHGSPAQVHTASQSEPGPVLKLP